MSKKLLLAVVIGALLLTAVVGVALAQGTNPPATATPAPKDEYQFGQRFPFPWGGRGMFGGMMDRMFGNDDTDMFDMMGMMGMPGMMGGFGLFGERGGGWQVYDAVAAALKLTPTQLFEQLHSGKTLTEIAEAQGVALADVMEAAHAAALEAMKARIEAAVKAGQLTREQADRMLERMDGDMGFSITPRGGFFRNWRFGGGTSF